MNRGMFRYFVYVSDTKVDMLLAQISPDAKKKVATELKIDAKILSASRKSEVEVGANRYERLDAVVRFLDAYGDVGSVDEPGEFFRGSLLMRWGPYADSFIPSGDEPLVYFGGSTERTIVGLGGSAKHVVGSGGDSNPHSHSAMPYLLAYLQAHVGSGDTPFPVHAPIGGADPALVATHLATIGMRGAEQQLHFVAKRLKFGPSPYPHRDPFPKMNVLLGTPVFVALEE